MREGTAPPHVPKKAAAFWRNNSVVVEPPPSSPRLHPEAEEAIGATSTGRGRRRPRTVQEEVVAVANRGGCRRDPRALIERLRALPSSSIRSWRRSWISAPEEAHRREEGEAEEGGAAAPPSKRSIASELGEEGPSPLL
jgi:hypothetical protein